MADLRQNTGIRDDFNRADEDPFLSPWLQVDTTITLASLIGNQFSRIGSTNAAAYWSVQTFDGDGAEIWATISASSGANNDGMRAGLLQDLGGTNTHDGYWVRMIKPIGSATYRIERVDNGVYTQLGALVTESFPQGAMILFRREGGDVVCYRSLDSGANWTEIIRRTDSTYTTGLYLSLNVFGTNPTWDDFGGGPPEDFVPQIIRRWRYR